MTLLQMKRMFSEMAEIDNDPNSQKSIDYYKKLEDLERGNTKRKPTTITVKTMRRGKSSMEHITLGEDGQPLSREEALLKKKYTDFKEHSYPEVNSMDIFVPDYKDPRKKVRLANYRYPATRERRGVV